MAPTRKLVSNSPRVVAGVAPPPLTGRYEVLIPQRTEVIFFTDSLAGAARHVAIARWGDAEKTDEVLAFLNGVKEHGFLDVGGSGVRVYRPVGDGSPWVARVRGTQARPRPRFAIGDCVQVIGTPDAPPPCPGPGRSLRVGGIVALGDPRAGKQYAYVVGGGSGNRVSEDRLREADVPGAWFCVSVCVPTHVLTIFPKYFLYERCPNPTRNYFGGAPVGRAAL